MELLTLNKEIIDSKRYFSAFVPGPSSIIAGRPGLWAGRALLGLKVFMGVRELKDKIVDYERGKKASAIVGDSLGTLAIYSMSKPVKREVGAAISRQSRIHHDPFRKNGIGGRSWYEKPTQEDLVIVFHDANRAGPHIDVHIGRVSLVYRVKPDLYEKLRYNNEGLLTQKSKDLIIEHVRTEVSGGSRVPQNLDHSKGNAVSAWTGGDPTAKHYGAGRTRQTVLSSSVDVYKTNWNGPMEMYAPAINPHRSLYLYKLHRGDSKKAPICIWGVKSAKPIQFQDRLHLKMMKPEDIDTIVVKADYNTSTLKYDGSSAYVVIGPKGTTVWSPRRSAVTGEQIEYTPKLDGLANTHSPETIVAMGEVLFKYKGEYLPQATSSGILNSNQLLPKDVQPEIRLYRVDKVGRKSTYDLNFWDNRKLQQEVSKLNPKILKPVELMDPINAQELGFEGVVIAPFEGSVNDGWKLKYWQDPHDWRIDTVDFYPGERGGIAGVVRTTSLDSGKTFNLGPGQTGNRELVEDMMLNPSHYEGSVIKVQSRRGHEGRASKVVEFHQDKGLATY